MSPRSLLLAGLCLVSLHTTRASADIVRYRCTGPTAGPVRVVVEDTTCRGFTVGGKQQLFSRMASGTLLASQDGKTVVLIEDHLSGVVSGASIVIDLDREKIINPVVVQIWREGTRVAAYDVARLVNNVKKVASSVSHVRWVASLPADVDGAQFAIVTTSGRSITFDTKTGAITDERTLKR